MPTPIQYGHKTIHDLTDASSVNLRSDYFIMTRQNEANQYISYKTTFREISSALCADIKSAIKDQLEVNVTLDKLCVLNSIREIEQYSPTDLTGYLGSAKLLNEMNDEIKSKASASELGTTVVSGTYEFNGHCPKTDQDPSDPNDLVRLGYLSTLLEDGIYCDAGNTTELYSTEVLTNSAPGTITPADTCPIIIQNDKNCQIRISIAGSNTVTGIFLFYNRYNWTYDDVVKNVKEWAKSSTELSTHADQFIMIDTDKSEGYSYNMMFPLKDGQIICIFPKVIRKKVAYDWLKWTNMIYSAKNETKFNSLPGTVLPPLTQAQFADKATKAKYLNLREVGNPAKFIVNYTDRPEKVYRYYYTTATKSNISKIVPTTGNFPNGTDIEVLQFI